MVDAQEWLDSNITIDQKSQVKQIYIYLDNGLNRTANINKKNEGYYDLFIDKNLQLEGELVINNWTNLDHLSIRGGNCLNTDKTTTIKLTNLKVSNCPKLNSIVLYLTDCQILTANNLAILTSLRLKKNQLNTININSIPKLHTIECQDNQLTSLPVLPNLTKLECQNNPLLELLDLTRFPRLVSYDRWRQEIEQLKTRLNAYENQIPQLSAILLSNQPYNFQTLQSEIKRLKTQDLTIQIPLKKQELEQLTSNTKEKLTKAERYPLEKLLKKHSKTLQTDNPNLDKLNELKEILSEKLTQEELQTLLNKQKEVFNLEKHLDNLQTEQVAQIQIPSRP